MPNSRQPRLLARLTLCRDHAVAQPSDPLAWGVPIARGKLTDDQNVTLRAAGRLIPVQAHVAGRWPDGSAKWLFITAVNVGDLPAGAVDLCVVDADSLPTHPQTLKITQQGPDIFLVDTGTLRFEVTPTGPIVARFDALTQGRWQTLATDLDLCAAVERDGQITDYHARHQPRTIEVETLGPLSACIVIRGTHRSTAGKTFGPYALRLTVTAGLSRVAITHSMIFDGDPDADFLRASEVLLNAQIGNDPRFAFGGDAGREARFIRQFAPFLADWRFAQLAQDSVSHWRITRHIEPSLPGVFCDEGQQSDGWSEFIGSRGSVALAVREFAENSPKTLAIDAHTGTLTASLYPRTAPRLDLRRYSPLRYMMAYEGPCTWKHETHPAAPAANAHGIRKTHDLLLAFNEANPSATADLFNRPLRLTWQPAYTAKTGVIVPASKKADPRWKKIADSYVALLRDSLVRGGASGYLNYFDLPMGFNLLEQRWTHEHGGLAYINNEALPCLGLFQSYLTTGNRDALKLALAMARHNSDSDTYYLGRSRGFGSRHNVSHWGDACKEPRISQPIDKRLGYFLAGDRACLDTTKLLLEVFIEIFQNGRWVNVVAELPSFLSTAIFASDLGLFSDDAWLIRVADAVADSIDEHGRMKREVKINSADRTATPIPDAKNMDYLMFSCFGAPQILPELAERYDHQKLRDALLRLGRYQMLPRARRIELEPENGENVLWDSVIVFRSLDLLGYCYQLTGDESIAEYVEKITQRPYVEVVEAGEVRYGIAGAGTRAVPIEHPWPDDDGRFLELVKKYRPVPGTDTGQTFNMAVYLHKLQGLMMLAQRAR